MADFPIRQGGRDSPPALETVRVVIHRSMGSGPPTVSVSLVRLVGTRSELRLIEHLELGDESPLQTAADVYEAVMTALDPTR